jgi:hypothetical protein
VSHVHVGGQIRREDEASGESRESLGDNSGIRKCADHSGLSVALAAPSNSANAQRMRAICLLGEIPN